MQTYFFHCTLITPDRVIPDGALLAENGVITALDSQRALPCPPHAQTEDAGGMVLLPGFIDLQLNGGFGLDFTHDAETIWQVGEKITRHGVTAFLPTIITSAPEAVAKAQSVLHQGPPDGYHGATALGLHLEGPFINPLKRGAHPQAQIRVPNPQSAESWSPQDGIRLVTLAPELPEALELVHSLVQRGVVVGCGHSMANYQEALAAFDAGARYGTHLFNAMPAFDHRQPGLVIALLTDPRPVIGMIPDGIHLHPAVVKLVWELAGAERVNIVTDATAALGMRPGRYRLGEIEVIVDETSARLENGGLAGSLLSLDQGLRNLIAFTGCSLQEALQTITSLPARLLGLEAVCGKLAPGQPANLVCLTHALEVAAVYLGGKSVYRLSSPEH